MSKNKGIRERLEKIYGPGCMVERAGIRYIPVEKRRKIKGYKKTDEKITYHHIKEKSKGGQKTIQNGALVRGYNHQWIHSLPEAEKEKVNEQLQQFKLNILSLRGDGKISKVGSIELDFGQLREEDCITIPVFNSGRSKKGADKKDEILRRQERKSKKYPIMSTYYKELEEDDEEER